MAAVSAKRIVAETAGIRDGAIISLPGEERPLATGIFLFKGVFEFSGQPGPGQAACWCEGDAFSSLGA